MDNIVSENINKIINGINNYYHKLNTVNEITIAFEYHTKDIRKFENLYPYLDIYTENKLHMVINIYIIDYSYIYYIFSLLESKIYTKINTVNFYYFGNVEINTLLIPSYINIKRISILYFTLKNSIEEIYNILKLIPDNLKSLELSIDYNDYQDYAYLNIIKLDNYNMDMTKFINKNINYLNINLIISNDINDINDPIADKFIVCDFTNFKNRDSNLKELTIHKLSAKSLNNIKYATELKLLRLNLFSIMDKNYDLKIYSDKIEQISICQYNDIDDNYLKSLIIISKSIKNISLGKILNNEPILVTNNLNDLRLYDNYIPELSTKFFVNLPNIKDLEINNCKLKKLNPIISMCKKLETLVLHNNELTIMPDHLKSITMLILSNNPLITLDNVIFKDLKVCRIQNTNIKRLTLPKTPKLLDLEEINCDNIEYIDDKIKKYIKKRY